MIYFLAEFCLNSLNGTFFDSINQIKSSTLLHAKLAPYVSIFVLMFGFNTVNISVIFCQLLFLYSIFHRMDNAFIEIIENLLLKEKSSFTHVITKIIQNIPIVPLFVSLNLNTAYITDSNKVNSLLSRILYTMSSYFSNSLLSGFISIKILEFAISFTVHSLFSKFYLTSQLKTSALIFSFSGTYFFLKTHSKSDAFGILNGKEFNFSLKLNETPSMDLIGSWIAFGVLFMTSFMSQMLIRYLISKLANIKRKNE